MPGPDPYPDICRLLFREAELLDAGEVRTWLDEIVDRDILYEVPIRTTRERGAGDVFSDEGFHLRETHATLTTRVLRLETEYAWAEDPPSRTRRYVTNVMVDPAGDDGWNVSSNLLVFRSRYDSTDHVLVSSLRRDVIRRRSNGFRLVRRTVLLDHTALPVHNLGIFL